jgi:hypothetical protein
LVAEAVCSELVSAWEFPDLQGIIRELSPESVFLAISASDKPLKSQRFSRKFPAARDQGSSSAEQGSNRGTGNCEAVRRIRHCYGYDVLREHDARGERWRPRSTPGCG